MDIYYQKMSFEVIHAVDRFRPLTPSHPDFNRNRLSCIQSSETSIGRGWSSAIRCTPWPSADLWINLMLRHPQERRKPWTTLPTAL